MALKFLKRFVKKVYFGYKGEYNTSSVYDNDGLRSIHNHSFICDPCFQKAYARGVQACKDDYKWQWRVHIGLWAAHSANKLDGDFIECGVNKGFLSSSIMNLLDWNKLDKTFFLLDTFEGINESLLTDEEKKLGYSESNKRQLKNKFYVDNVETVKKNFSEWKNVRIIKGTIPATLNNVTSKKVAFLHIDLNCTVPELESIKFFWDKLVPGAFILLEDYAYRGYHVSKKAMDDFAATKNVMIASLPTGQGIIVKPPK